MFEWTPRQVDSFLFFGYIPRLVQGWEREPWAMVERDRLIPTLSPKVLEQTAGEAFSDAVGARVGDDNVVLLSGGNDSRAILGALREHVAADKIVAVTYGSPRTYDYEIPRHLSRAAGVRHVQIDLSRYRFSDEDLRQVAQEFRNSPQWLFGPLMNRLVVREFGTGPVYWSGYLGGPVTGSHIPADRPSNTWNEALAKHARRPVFGGNWGQIDSAFDAVEALPRFAAQLPSPLTLDEYVDLAARQHPWLRPEHLVSGHHYAAPFLDPRFLHIMFNAGRENRAQQRLYRRFLQARYPTLFELPHKDHMGLPPAVRRDSVRWKVKLFKLRARRLLARARPQSTRWIPPSTNHIDWNHALRFRQDLRDLTQDAIDSLGRRPLGNGLAASALLENHRRGDLNAGLALTQLVSLEYYLRQGQ